MNRNLLIGVAAIALSACVLSSAAVIAWPNVNARSEALKYVLLGMTDTATETKLQPVVGANGPAGATETVYFHPTGNPQSRVETPGGGTLDYYLRNSDRSVEFALEYFPSSAGHGEQSLRHATKYADDGKTPLQEIGFRAGGNREMTGKRLPNGDYQLRDYFDDGINLEMESVTGRSVDDPFTFDAPVILRETRWRENNTVALTNMLNADFTRDITGYDDQEGPVVLTHLTPQVEGSTTVGYYPGTKTLRVRSTSTYEQTMADLFRTDGTLSTQLIIGASTLEYISYDSSGKKKLLDQLWWYQHTSVDGIDRMSDFRLYTVTKMDENGEPALSWDMSITGRLWTFDRYNITVDGARWKEVVNFYDDKGFLRTVSFIDQGQSGPTKMVDHTPQENVKGQFPPEELTKFLGVTDIFALPVQQTAHE